MYTINKYYIAPKLINFILFTLSELEINDV